jgi:Asp-tRNA(Asn)/Glu-tRNA(Gln) amidotransferase C subunit
LADNTSLSDTDITGEFASIIERVSDLTELATSGQDDTPDANEVANRLRRMDKQEEAKELEMLIARAEELKSASSDSS